MKTRWVLLALAAATLSGCAGLRLPELASCDGTEKRSLNKGNWNWAERAALDAPARSCG